MNSTPPSNGKVIVRSPLRGSLMNAKKDRYTSAGLFIVPIKNGQL